MKPATELKLLKALLFVLNVIDVLLRGLGILVLLIIGYHWWNK